MNKGCGCQSIGCITMLIIISIVVFFIYTLAQKPGPIWNNIVEYLNDDLEVPEYTQENLIITQLSIANQIEDIGINEVIISENNLTTLIRDNIKDLKNPVVDLEGGEMKIIWELYTKEDREILYGVASIKTEDHKLYIEKIGTNRLGFPKIINQLVASGASKIKELEKEGETSGDLLLELLNTNDDYEIKEVRFIDDSIYILLDVKIKLFDN